MSNSIIYALVSGDYELQVRVGGAAKDSVEISLHDWENQGASAGHVIVTPGEAILFARRILQIARQLEEEETEDEAEEPANRVVSSSADLFIRAHQFDNEPPGGPF